MHNSCNYGPAASHRQEPIDLIGALILPTSSDHTIIDPEHTNPDDMDGSWANSSLDANAMMMLKLFSKS